MRPGQNKRMRGRPSNNRRGPNPLTRSYESNGPDVKIRGNAHHVAEKYLQLARDAHTGGDPVAAENYLQHAEHYFRLIAAAQAAQLQAQGGGRPPGEGEAVRNRGRRRRRRRRPTVSPRRRNAPPFPTRRRRSPTSSSPARSRSSASQPYAERAPGEGDRQGQADRGGYQGRQDRPSARHQDRGPRPDRPFRIGRIVRGQRGARRATARIPSLPRTVAAARDAGPGRSAGRGRRRCPRSSPRRRASSDPRTSARPEPGPIVENAAEPSEAVESGAPRVEASGGRALSRPRPSAAFALALRLPCRRECRTRTARMRRSPERGADLGMTGSRAGVALRALSRRRCFRTSTERARDRTAS